MNRECLSYSSKTDVKMYREVVSGLSLPQKKIHPKYLYDKRGSELFELICDLKEYYLSRTEIGILQNYAEEIADMIGEEVILIEPGAGNGEKVRYFLEKLERPSAYIPIEISRDMLMQTAKLFHMDFPDVFVNPICVDYTHDFSLPVQMHFSAKKRVVFFPGSTIGNMEEGEAVRFLSRIAEIAKEDGGLLIGVDLKKNRAVLESAYNDSEGVTAEFNMNLLHRMNRELHASFDSRHFQHCSVYNAELGRIEMHLVSLIPQIVNMGAKSFRFREGESIHTESSYKYSEEEFVHLVTRGGFKLENAWFDPKRWFGVFYFSVKSFQNLDTKF